MQVRDLIFLPHSGKPKAHDLWEIQDIHLGAAGQESLVELKSLCWLPGVSVDPERVHNTTIVPASLIEGKVYRKLEAGQ